MAMASLIDMHRLLLPVHKGESPPTDRNMRFVTLLFGVIMLIEYTILVRQLRTLASKKAGHFGFRTILRGMGLLFFMYVPRYLARFIPRQHGFSWDTVAFCATSFLGPSAARVGHPRGGDLDVILFRLYQHAYSLDGVFLCVIHVGLLYSVRMYDISPADGPPSAAWLPAFPGYRSDVFKEVGLFMATNLTIWRIFLFAIARILMTEAGNWSETLGKVMLAENVLKILLFGLSLAFHRPFHLVFGLGALVQFAYMGAMAAWQVAGDGEKASQHAFLWSILLLDSYCMRLPTVLTLNWLATCIMREEEKKAEKDNTMERIEKGDT